MRNRILQRIEAKKNKKYSNTDSGIEGMFGMPMKRELKDINS